jgi:hypothetical protein
LRRSAPAEWARSIARATRGLKHDVAVKVIPASLSADSFARLLGDLYVTSEMK